MLSNRTKVEKIGGLLFLTTVGIIAYGFINLLHLDLSNIPWVLVGNFFIAFLTIGFLVVLFSGGALYWIVRFMNALEAELNPNKLS